MEIKRSGSQPSGKGPADYFTGAVRVDPLFQSPDPARVVGASVTFEPGARTAWHTHPLGQTLVVQAAALTGIPAGGGVAELGLTAAFGDAMPTAAMATALLLWRGATLYLGLVAGLAAVLVLFARKLACRR